MDGNQSLLLILNIVAKGQCVDWAQFLKKLFIQKPSYSWDKQGKARNPIHSSKKVFTAVISAFFNYITSILFFTRTCSNDRIG